MTLKEFYRIHNSDIERLIRSALNEDSVRDDVTTRLVLPGSKGAKLISARVICKEDCILAGLDIFKRVFEVLNANIHFRQFSKDGRRVKKHETVLEIKSEVRSLLSGERTALNFLQRMSGIATLTNEFVKRLRFPHAKILHTRKTTPNFRPFEIAAVKIGGGDFHRYDLSSSIMVKDNHIAATDLFHILKRAKKKQAKDINSKTFEVEVKNFEELDNIVKYGKDIVKIVMLDNFKAGDIERAAGLLKDLNIRIEVSGGINLKNFGTFQNRFVNYYSIGMLTHSYKSIDFSLEF
jgi:nicotinate-nucleotide pyrophosphorylase (carboxylating)